MNVLVKIGGTLLDAEEPRRRLAAELAEEAHHGARLVVVHGGGKQMTRYLAERGIESRFIGGLRVTTPETIDAVLKVFAGSVNHRLVAEFVAAGARAVGLSGIDARLVEAEPMGQELGAVGRPARVHAELLDLLTARGYVPVVACVAGDGKGGIYNVNADQMAAACAAAFGAARLLFLTDVEGVLDAEKRVLAELTPAQARDLIARGTAGGGMQAKLNAAVEALQAGVGQVMIAPGAVPGIVRRALAGAAIGTRLIAEAAVA